MKNHHPLAPCCGNCMFLQMRQPDTGAGLCFRYPPSIVVLHDQQADIMRGQQAVVQKLTAVRVTMQPSEFCGEFRPTSQPLSRLRSAN